MRLRARLASCRRSWLPLPRQPRSSPSTPAARAPSPPTPTHPSTAATRRSRPPTSTCPSPMLDPKTRLELIRVLQAEQGFAMRPVPARPQGPDAGGQRQARTGRRSLSQHGHQQRHLRQARRPPRHHRRQDRERRRSSSSSMADPTSSIASSATSQIGGDPNYDQPRRAGRRPGARRLAPDPRLSRATCPNSPAAQVKALLAPLISFDVKTPDPGLHRHAPDQAQRRHSQPPGAWSA